MSGRCSKIEPTYRELSADDPIVRDGFRVAGDRIRVCKSCGRPLAIVLRSSRGAAVASSFRHFDWTL